MSELSFHIQIRRKGNWFLASAPELDFISQGQTIEEARKNLLEVIRIQFEEMREMGTLQEYLTECGFVAKGDRMVPQSEIVRLEESIVSVG
jgi:predicted RNase H-like HicB family nuclease